MEKTNDYDAHIKADEKVIMETPDGVQVEVMRKRIPFKIKLGWRVVEKGKKQK